MGVATKGLNAIYFGRWIVLFTEVLTGLIIMLGLFGWMDVLIFAKWTYVMQPYSNLPADIATINQAPSIITVMINNFLAGGYPNAPNEPDQVPPKPQPYFLPGQRETSELLVLIVLICVPIMLCFKPCYLNCTHKDEHANEEFDRVEPIENEEE